MAPATMVLTETGHAVADGTWRSPLDGYHFQRKLWKWLGGPGWFFSEENRKIWEHLVGAHDDVVALGYSGEYLEFERCDGCHW